MSKFFDGELLSGYEESPKTTIFGEEHFIDTTMIKLVQQKNEAVDNYVFEQMANSLKGSVLVEMPQVIIDKEKLKKWVVLCMKLENIEHSELVDMATKKRIIDLEAKLAQSKMNESFEKEKKDNAFKLIEVLKQRLKDTIKIYSDDFVEKDKELKELRFKARNIFPLVENLEDKVNQDKISFAVSELERAKIEFETYYADRLNEYPEYLEDRIMQLKEGK